MLVNLTYNDNIKTFEDIARYLELKEDRLLAERPTGKAYYVGSSSHRVSKSKYKRQGGSFKHKTERLSMPNIREASAEVRRTRRKSSVTIVASLDTSLMNAQS
ncbi:hypothetical protein Ancab_040622 [Ancistrocladus abbreviatus]